MLTSLQKQLLAVGAVIAVTGIAIYVGPATPEPVAVAAAEPAPDMAEPSGLDARWQTWKEADALTDKVKAGVLIAGKGGSLALKCDEAGKGSVYVLAIFDAYLGRSEYGPLMRYRFDKGDVRFGQFAQDKSTAALSDRQSVEVFVNQMEKASHVAFEAKDYELNAHQMSVDLPTAKEAVAKVYSDCNDTTRADKEQARQDEAARNQAWIEREIRTCGTDKACLDRFKDRYLAKLGLK